MGATQVSIDEWMDEENVLCIHDGILLSLKKERNSNICYNMDETWEHYAKWNMLVTKDSILYDFSCISYFIKSIS